MINIITRERIDGRPRYIGNVQNPTLEHCLAAGWREDAPEPELVEGYTRVSRNPFVDGEGGSHGWQVVDVLTSEIEAEKEAADMAHNRTRYELQNQYLALCDLLTGKTTHEKLGFAELRDIIDGMMATNPQEAMMLSLKLLSINAALVREAGAQWWDNCNWKVIQ